MKKLMLAALGASIAISAAVPAMAADGCGRGFHRGAYGHCRPNGGPGYNRPGYGRPALIIGNRYDRGYWDGRRYWQHRERWNGGWRYR